MSDLNEYLLKTRALVEKACLLKLVASLDRVGASPLSAEIASLIPDEPTGHLSATIVDPRHTGETIKLGITACVVPRGYAQNVPVSTQKESEELNHKRSHLMRLVESWISAFSRGSPELAERCAEALGIPKLAGRVSSCRTGILFAEEDAEMLAAAVLVVFPDGASRYLPSKSEIPNLV